MGRQRRECDVAVVGAGPAGSSAALAAVRGGADVVVLERRTRVGEPVQCAELAPAPLLREVDVSSAAVVQMTCGIATHLPSGEVVETASPGAMLDRAAFDQELSSRAVDAGAELLLATRAVGWDEDGALVAASAGGEFEIASAVVVGADGPRSLVGRRAGLENEAFALAKQIEVPLGRPLDESHVFFDAAFYGGYGWLFPKGETANLGVGVDRSRSDEIDAALGRLIEIVDGLGLADTDAVLGRTGGAIPAGGALGTARAGRILLAGDAAGQTHPVTGAGIHAAVSCGTAAGRAAARFIGSGDESDLARYEREWRLLWDDVLALGARRRAELLERWDGDLEAAVRECWVVFPEYHAKR